MSFQSKKNAIEFQYAYRLRKTLIDITCHQRKHSHVYLLTQYMWELDAILNMSSFHPVQARDDESVHNVEATQAVEDVLNYIVKSSRS